MTQQNAEQEPATAPAGVLFQTICDFMLPFFIIGAGGDAASAERAIAQLIEAYEAATLRELELIGRIIAFSAAATDTLSRSMRPDLSDAQILRYRSSAISLSRMADQCQATLDKLQTVRRVTEADSERPAIAAVKATSVAPLRPRPEPAPPDTPLAQPKPIQQPVGPAFGLGDIGVPQMKQDISLMIRSLDKRWPQGAPD